ncbi:MAG: 3'-5' exonuclease [Bacteroidetes bacterium]|nr:3'-5' exonuclease [Bacteroidota bacterium]
MKVLKNLDVSNIVFLDIETVSQQQEYEVLENDWKLLWDKKAKALAKNEESAEEVYERAGIYAEFGKIICIGVGVLREFGDGYKLRVKTFSGDDEKILLKEFADMLNGHYHGHQFLLCAHNGKEFDFPYLSRRMLVHGIVLPQLLDNAGKKPWEVPHLDTMELWKFGDYKNFTSLNLLAKIFDIPTPKDDIDGSQVGSVYWQDHDLERIALYCSKDVITLTRLFLKFRGEGFLEDERVEYIRDN